MISKLLQKYEQLGVKYLTYEDERATGLIYHSFGGTLIIRLIDTLHYDGTLTSYFTNYPLQLLHTALYKHVMLLLYYYTYVSLNTLLMTNSNDINIWSISSHCIW